MTAAHDERAQEVLAAREDEFEQITGLAPRYDIDFQRAALSLCAHLAGEQLQPFDVRRNRFLAHVNWKFRVNAEGLKQFYRLGARRRFTFNYHEKNDVQLAFDSASLDTLRAVIEGAVSCPSTREELLRAFDPVPPEHTIRVLRSECDDPSRLRRPQGDRDVAKEILQSQFGAFLFCSLGKRGMHRYFDPLYSDDTYRESFWEELHARSPHLFNRDGALVVARIDNLLLEGADSYASARDHLCAWIAHAYQKLNNYSYLALHIVPVSLNGRQVQWELAADAMLYGEKHREVSLRKAYFRWKDVKKTTASYIKEMDVDVARFELANEGFTYKDCFVLALHDRATHGEESLLLLFQKNQRDETVVPCPACRSHDVQGNSYPSLGVRSWECRNLLCPDRSKYNRGKRYSFKGLLMQQAIDDEHNEVPAESVRSWLRDVQTERSNEDVLEMLLRHYSLYGDVVHVYNWPGLPEVIAGRRIRQQQALESCDAQAASNFFKGPFFERYIVERAPREGTPRRLGDDTFEVLCGEAHATLSSLAANSFDAAVTSPPYYNAREYSQWDNIYCYLHDMYNIAAAVFRCLKPGALYLYNIFDYFDNERSVVFSAMGQKRMILSAYTVDMFRRLGFTCLGNVAWDKGDIEGKRGFNAGNFSPYYQSPFNCWEHILIFQKPRTNGANARLDLDFPAVLRAQPVIKMVRGQNTHGHTAPFPDELPVMLLKQLPRGSRVLDPFGGSLTTGRVAERLGLRSLCVEQHMEYCELGLELRKESHNRRVAQERLRGSLRWAIDSMSMMR